MRLNPSTRLRLPPLRERREDLPELVRFAFLEALRAEQLRPLVRAFLARFPTPEDLDESAHEVVFGRPRAAAARRDAFSVFVSREALERLAEHDWPGNHRELRLLATNALVFCLTRYVDAAVGVGPTSKAQERTAQEGALAVRAPAILDVPDRLVEQLLGAVPGTRSRAPAVSAVARGRAGSRRIEIQLTPAGSFARVSGDVEKQYLRALFQACAGDLSRMAHELLGPRGSARQVHLRLNQLGLRLRDLRGETP
jgi:DNA-binding NtrC family response regulator